MSDLSLETIFENWAPAAPHPEDQVELLLDQIAQLPEIPEPSTPLSTPPSIALAPPPQPEPETATIPAGTTWSRADDDILPTRRFRRRRRTAA
jgi:hypothetical protein